MTDRVRDSVTRTTVQILCLIALSGCGGSESDSGGMCMRIQNCGVGSWDRLGVELSLAWGSGQCIEECIAGAVQTDFAAGIVTNDFIEANWTTTRAVETEPNDNAAEASPFVIAGDAGVRVTGAVNDATDAADFVAFSTLTSDLHVIAICRAIGECTRPFLQSDEAYVDVLDQNGNVILTTNQMQTIDGHEIRLSSSVGLLYLAAVRASNTGDSDFDYELVISN